MVRPMPKHRKTLPGLRQAGIALALGLILVAPLAWSQSLEGQPLPVRGSNLAVVEIVEVGDFECPHCAKAQAALKQVLEAYPQQVRLVFLHQPLPFHDQALQAALATRVAQKSGKFWEMADTFFAEHDAEVAALLADLGYTGLVWGAAKNKQDGCPADIYAPRWDPSVAPKASTRRFGLF